MKRKSAHMLALRFYGRRDIRLEEVPKPTPQEGEVLLRITDAGISQTQVNEFIEGPFIINTTPHPLTGKSTPLIPCQEFGGIVDVVGEGVSEEWIGKQVAVLPLMSCGECEACRSGHQNHCSKLAYRELLGEDGGFCEYYSAPVEALLEVKERQLLTFIEPFLVALHAARRLMQSGFHPKEKAILILGAGAIGVSMAFIFQALFGTTPTITDILPPRLKRAAACGLATTPKETLSTYDLVIDAAGMDPVVNEPAILEGFSYLKPGGILLNLGTYFHSLSFIPSSLLLKEHTLITSFAYDLEDVGQLALLLQEFTPHLYPLIEILPLSAIIEEGYFRAEVAKESFTRLVVRPHDA